ncbi:MAG TPA: lysylphosphatidylglycerol synthase transmembrane domain-containing protein [Solirubrobacteraceae bacterium]|nr:lysylphosphatidylglycerol synthase transmembrane domain-containing protein [Solirubrobacteraceae bacterium]
MAATERPDRPRDDLPDEFDSRHLVRRLIGFAILIGVVAVAVISLPGLGSLRHRFSDVDARLLIAIALLKLASCLSNIVAFRDVFCPRMSWRFSYRLGMAEQATNVLLPTGGAGGLALGAWALHQGGMESERIGRRSVAFFVLTSLPNFALAAVLGPLLLLHVFSARDPVAWTAAFSGLAWLTAIATALLPLFLRRIAHNRMQGRVSGKLRIVIVSLAGGIRDVGTLIRERRWRAILGAVGYLVFDIGAMLVAFAAYDSHFAIGATVFGYDIGQLGGLIPLPGGVGGTDGGLIGAFVLYGSTLATATAAVLTYRVFQVAVPAILGAFAFVGLRHTLTGAEPPKLGTGDGEPCADPGDRALEDRAPSPSR